MSKSLKNKPQIVDFIHILGSFLARLKIVIIHLLASDLYERAKKGINSIQTCTAIIHKPQQ